MRHIKSCFCFNKESQQYYDLCLKNRGGFSEAQTTANPPKDISPSAVSNAEVSMRQHGDSTAIQLIFWRFAYFESRAAVLSSAPTDEHLRNYRYRLSLTQQSQPPQPKLINHRFILLSGKPSKTQKHIQTQLISLLCSIPLSNYPFRMKIPEDPIQLRFTLETQTPSSPASLLAPNIPSQAEDFSPKNAS